MHTSPDRQSVLVAQVVLHAVALAQAYAPQEMLVVTQLPVPLHCFCVSVDDAQLEPQSVAEAILPHAPEPLQLPVVQALAAQDALGLVPLSAFAHPPAALPPWQP